MKTRKYSASVKAVREILSLGVKEARKQTGLPAPVLNRIISGKTKKISHGTFNKFRNAHARIIYHTLVENNVSPKEARRRKYGLTFEKTKAVVKMTRYGKPFDTALNDIENEDYEVKKAKKIPDSRRRREVMKDIKDKFDRERAKEKREYRKLARIICQNNGFYTQWIAEGKCFLNSKTPVHNKTDCVNLMLQIMAYGDRSLQDWDFYVTEQRPAERWQPYKYQKVKGTRKYARVPLPATDPKYVEWQRRTARGEIIQV
jgi:hypothetical protein